jgi:hypothetical protein
MAHVDVDKVFLNLTVTIGPDFYGGMKHDSNEEIAEVLASHAKHSDGLLRETLLLLEKFYRTRIGMPLNPLVETPDPNVAGATGSYTGGTTITYGECGRCAAGKGRFQYQDGQVQGCVAC